MSVRARAWIALTLPPLAWYTFEQGLSALLHVDCSQATLGAIWGVGSLALCGVAFRLGARLAPDGDALVDPWLARLAMVIAGMFGLAIAFQTLAVAVVPACVR